MKGFLCQGNTAGSNVPQKVSVLLHGTYKMLCLSFALNDFAL